jgi:hypothetical protein
MFKPSRLAVILGLAGALAGLPSVMVAQQEGTKDSDAGVAEAIRFQRAEDAAAARQARVGAAPKNESNSADRMASEPAAPARKDSEGGGVAAAVRFQRAEDEAAARQARIEAGENGQQSADRSMTQSKPESKTKTKAPKNAMARKASPPRNSQ